MWMWMRRVKERIFILTKWEERKSWLFLRNEEVLWIMQGWFKKAMGSDIPPLVKSAQLCPASRLTVPLWDFPWINGYINCWQDLLACMDAAWTSQCELSVYPIHWHKSCSIIPYYFAYHLFSVTFPFAAMPCSCMVLWPSPHIFYVIHAGASFRSGFPH